MIAGDAGDGTPASRSSGAPKAALAHRWNSHWMGGGGGAALEGVSAEVGVLLVRVCTESALENDTALASGSSDKYVYIDHLRWSEWRLHLTLMLLGGDNTKVVRRYGGRIVERMLRNIRCVYVHMLVLSLYVF